MRGKESESEDEGREREQRRERRETMRGWNENSAATAWSAKAMQWCTTTLAPTPSSQHASQGRLGAAAPLCRQWTLKLSRWQKQHLKKLTPPTSTWVSHVLFFLCILYGDGVCVSLKMSSLCTTL